MCGGNQVLTGLEVGDEAEVVSGPDAVYRLIERGEAVRDFKCRAVQSATGTMM